jgi:hypothetical protein
MENAYQPELWHDLYVMLGTSAAALIGLLFIVTSLRLNEIMNNPVYRNRARNMTVHLLALLVQAIFILTPQPMAALGAELVAVNLLWLGAPLSFTYQAVVKNPVLGKSGGFSVYRALAFIVGYLFGIAGGAALIAGSSWGLYLVTTTYVIFLVSVVLNARGMMLGLEQTGKTKKAK